MNSPIVRPRPYLTIFSTVAASTIFLSQIAAAAPEIVTNSVAFQPTQYPTIKIRHIPSTNAAKALLLHKPSDRKTNLPSKKGTTSKGGDTLVTDDSYLVREVAPPAKPTAVIVTNSAAANSAASTQPSQAVK